MKSTYLVSLLSPRLPERNGRLLPCCCLQYVKDRFFMRTRKTPFRSPAPEFFPKASAKVRQFRELTKFFRGFFHEKRNFFSLPPAQVPVRQVAESTKTAELCKRTKKTAKGSVKTPLHWQPKRLPYTGSLHSTLFQAFTRLRLMRLQPATWLQSRRSEKCAKHGDDEAYHFCNHFLLSFVHSSLA